MELHNKLEPPKIYGSFSSHPGLTGYKFFTKYFKKYNINAIYQPFKITDIKKAIESIKILNISGVGISMPFKTECLKYIDELSEETKNIEACNTIKNDNGKLIGYNTDYKAILNLLNYKKLQNKQVYILGNGGYAKSAFYACKLKNINYINITRKNWNDINDIKNSLIINCTPVENISENNNHVYYASVKTNTGKILAKYQAKEQFRIYTNVFIN